MKKEHAISALRMVHRFVSVGVNVMCLFLDVWVVLGALLLLAALADSVLKVGNRGTVNWLEVAAILAFLAVCFLVIRYLLPWTAHLVRAKNTEITNLVIRRLGGTPADEVRDPSEDVGRVGLWQRVRHIALVAIVTLAAIFVAWEAGLVLISRAQGPVYSQDELAAQARKAVAACGGWNALTNEIRVAFAYHRQKKGEQWQVPVADCPLLYKLGESLPTSDKFASVPIFRSRRTSLAVDGKAKDRMVDIICIRFGNHHLYGNLWIFEDDKVGQEVAGDATHLEGGLYFSTRLP